MHYFSGLDVPQCQDVEQKLKTDRLVFICMSGYTVKFLIFDTL